MRILRTAFVLLLCLAAAGAAAQTRNDTAISFRGTLNQSGSPATGQYNFRLRLFDTATGGTLLATRDAPGIAVFDGRYSFPVDFGANVFTGGSRWIEVQVAPSSGGSYQTLSARTEVFVVPYAETAMGVLGGHAKANQQCPSGQVVAGVNAAGSLICVAAAGGGTVNLFSRIVVVPGDDTPRNNGEALRAAVDFVTQQPRDADNRWKILLEPGTFDLGAEGIQLYNDMALEGSGIESTVVVSASVSGTPSDFPGRYRTISARAYSSVKKLTAINRATGFSGSGVAVTAISAYNTRNVAIRDVRAVSESPANAGFGTAALEIGRRPAAGDDMCREIRIESVEAIANREAIAVYRCRDLTLQGVEVRTEPSDGESASVLPVKISQVTSLNIEKLVISAKAGKIDMMLQLDDVGGNIQNLKLYGTTQGSTFADTEAHAHGVGVYRTSLESGLPFVMRDVFIELTALGHAVGFPYSHQENFSLYDAIIKVDGGRYAGGIQVRDSEGAPGYRGAMRNIEIDARSPMYAQGAELGPVAGYASGPQFSNLNIRTESFGTGVSNGVHVKPVAGDDIVFSDISIESRRSGPGWSSGFVVLKDTSGSNSVVLRRVKTQVERSDFGASSGVDAATFSSNVAAERLRLVIEDSRFQSIGFPVGGGIWEGFTHGVSLRRVDADIRNSSFSSGGNWSINADCCDGFSDAPSLLRLTAVNVVDDVSGVVGPSFTFHGSAQAVFVNSYVNGTENYQGDGGVTGSMDCIATTVGDTFIERGDCSNIPRVPLFD